MRPSKRIKTSHQPDIEATTLRDTAISLAHQPGYLPLGKTSTPNEEAEVGANALIISAEQRNIENAYPSPRSSVHTKPDEPEHPVHDYSWLDSPKRSYTTDPYFSTNYLIGWIWEHGAPVMKHKVKYGDGLFWLCRHCFSRPSSLSGVDDPEDFEAMQAMIECAISNTEYNWSFDSGFAGALVEFHLLKKHGIAPPPQSAQLGLFEMFNLNPTNESHVELVRRLERSEDSETYIAVIERAFKTGVSRWTEEKRSWLEGEPSKNIHRELCKKAQYEISYR
jgi:hypothetical protein